MWAAVVLALVLVRVLAMCSNWTTRLVGLRAARSCEVQLLGSPTASSALGNLEKLHLDPSKLESESSSLRAPPSGLSLPNLKLFATALRLVLVRQVGRRKLAVHWVNEVEELLAPVVEQMCLLLVIYHVAVDSPRPRSCPFR